MAVIATGGGSLRPHVSPVVAWETTGTAIAYGGIEWSVIGGIRIAVALVALDGRHGGTAPGQADKN